jgi:hypothetical protein
MNYAQRLVHGLAALLILSSFFLFGIILGQNDEQKSARFINCLRQLASLGCCVFK